MAEKPQQPAAAAPSGGPETLSPDVLAGVFERLNLPPDLMGEPEAAKPPGPKTSTTAAADMPAAAEPAAEPQPEPEQLSEEPDSVEPAEEPAAAAEPEGEPEPEPEEAEPEEKPEETPEETEQDLVRQLEEARKELEGLAAKVKSLEEETKGEPVPIEIMPVDPLFLMDDESKIRQVERSYSEFEKWALKNWDGTDEVTDAEGKVVQPSYTAAQVRQRYGEIKEARERIPKAVAALEGRRAQAEAAKKIYPNLFNPKHADAQVLESVLKQAPGLKLFPNFYLIIGDSLEGERRRLAQAKAKAPSKPPGKKAVPPVPQGKPGAPKPGASAGRVAPKKAPGSGVSAQRFVELGGDRNALVTMLKGVNLPVARE